MMIDPIHLADVDALFYGDNEDLIRTYRNHWNLIPAHYPPGWCYDFWEPNRFLSRIIYRHLTTSGEKCSTLDFGCYDGLLVAALREQGFDAYGYEVLPCEAMFEVLGIQDRVNRRIHCEAVVALGIAHEYPFKQFVERVREENNGIPDIIFFDREPTRQTHYAKQYFDPAFIQKEGITVVRFPNCESDRSRAELLIWSLNA